MFSARKTPATHLDFPRRPAARFSLWCILLLLALCGSRVVAADPPGTSFRAAFWNIQWFPGRSPHPSASAEKRQINAVHREMLQLNADIIGLEEVRDWEHAALAISPLESVKVDVCSNFPPREDQPNGQQVAIASRLVPLSAWTERWKPRGAMTPTRGFAFAVYELAPRQLLFVYAVHFKSNRGELREDVVIREEAMRQLIAHIDAMHAAYSKLGSISCIVGGDFNTALDDRRFESEHTLRSLMSRGFEWVWQNVPCSERETLPADKLFPPACFDHIFFRGARLESARVIPTSRQASDHRPVLAAFEIAP